MSDVKDNIIRSFCNSCMQITYHELVDSKKIDNKIPDGSVTSTIFVILSCCGCKEPSIRKESWIFDHLPDSDRNSDGFLSGVVFTPPRLWRRPPQWLTQLETIDRDLKDLLDEVYSTTNDQQIRLLSMGVRAVLEHIMIKILEGDVGGFEQKLQDMVAKDHLTERQRENLSIVIDAGSASAHRGYRPSRPLIEEIVNIMENIVREHYITGPMLAHAKTKIPPKPLPRKK